jgi:exodeoxyribonuclease VII large subunit
MNIELLQELIAWRKEQARKEGVDLFRVLPNMALEAIARELPLKKEEFFRIKGIKEKKFARYGGDLVRLVGAYCQETREDAVSYKQETKMVYSVDTFLTKLNTSLSSVQARVRGEIQSLQIRGRAVYFSLKDTKEEALLSCFMWRDVLEYSNITPEEGMEVIVSGSPSIYKPTGRMSLQLNSLEPVGEGALKRAYEELKKKLEQEGLFDESRKKVLPHFPLRVGLITSRDGAVIHDFLNNVGQFGFSFLLRNSRVEGVQAVQDLSRALDIFAQKDIDILIIMRGGGSLESLQAFNNEMLVRKVADMPFPVLCAVGHHQDIPLLSYVADVSVSTPTAAAKKISEYWETSRFVLEEKTGKLTQYMERYIFEYEARLQDGERRIEQSFESILERFLDAGRRFRDFVVTFSQRLSQMEYVVRQKGETLTRMLEKNLEARKTFLDVCEQKLHFYNPRRVLRLGYAIMKNTQGAVVRGISNVKKGERFSVTLSDGRVNGIIQSITSYGKKDEEK